MALKQREWAIYIRPYYKSNTFGRVEWVGTARAGRRDVGASTTGMNTAIDLSGEGEGGGKTDDGSWVMWYKGSSFKELKQKYNELLEDVNKESIRVVEIFELDTIVTPLT